MNPLLFTLAYCPKDAELTSNLFQWMQELDGEVKHPCLLVVDSKVDPRERAFIKMRAESLFTHVQEIEFTEQPLPPPELLRWPPWRFQANQMFLRAAQHVWACCRLPFFWMEADATPLVPGWLDRLAESYYQQPMRYHGPIIIAGENKPSHWPERHMAGVAMYPMTAVHALAKYCTGEYTWDLGGGNDIVPQASQCRLIQHNYGPSEHEGWSFEVRDGKLACNHPVQQFVIREDAVVMHRCKDGSLIRALRALRIFTAKTTTKRELSEIISDIGQESHSAPLIGSAEDFKEIGRVGANRSRPLRQKLETV